MLRDIRISTNGPTVSFVPLTTRAVEWLKSHAPADVGEWFGGSLLVNGREPAGRIIEKLVPTDLNLYFG